MSNEFTFNCPKCGQKLEADKSMVGQCFDCPACDQPLEVPDLRQPVSASRPRPSVSRSKATSRRPCPYCGEQILRAAKKCKHCGEFLDKGVNKNIKNKKSNAQAKVAIGIGLASAVLIFLGLFHLVKGSQIIGFRLVPRASFGFSEIVVDVDKITSMPLISAKSRYPLGVKACQKAGLIETDEQFERRARQELQEDFDREYRKQMENVERETRRLMESLDDY